MKPYIRAIFTHKSTYFQFGLPIRQKWVWAYHGNSHYYEAISWEILVTRLKQEGLL